MGQLLLVFGGLTLINIVVGYTASEHHLNFSEQESPVPFVEIEDVDSRRSMVDAIQESYDSKD